MKIVNFKKFSRGVGLIFIAIFIISIFMSKVSFSYNSKAYNTIYVSSGDTLWSIACDLQRTNYYKGKDVRFIISDIKQINNLQNSSLSIGEELKIPVI